MPITREDILRLAPRADARIVGAIVDHAAAVFPKYGINSLNRLTHLFAHMDVESMGFAKLEENLNYSAQRLMQVWPRRFPTLTEANRCAHNPQALANVAYGGRLGNSGPNDGYLYRGQGLLQTTGKANVATLAKHLGVSVDEARQMLTSEAGMLECAVANFVFNGALPYADRDDIVGSTKAVNGGLNGLADRKAALHKAKTIFGADALVFPQALHEAAAAVAPAAPLPPPPPTAAPVPAPEPVPAPAPAHMPAAAAPDPAPMPPAAAPDADDPPNFFESLLYKFLGE